MFQKTCLFIAGISSFVISHAQPIINNTDYIVGNEISYSYKVGLGVISPGSSGENVIWDFSSLNAKPEVSYVSYNCNIYCDTFKGSTFYNKNLEGSYNSYYIKNGSGLYLNGYRSQNGDSVVNNKFENSEQLLIFPIQFNATFTDSFSNTFYHHYPPNLYIGTQYGKSITIVDAYGTIKTPTGTYTNVLRVKKKDITVTNNKDHSNIESYQWYQAGIGHPVMEINLSRDGNINSNYRYTTKKPNNAEAIIHPFKVNVSTDPVLNIVGIKVETVFDYSIVIKNMAGDIYYDIGRSFKIQETSVSCTDWPKGIYLIEVKDEHTNSFIQRLIID